MIVMKIWQKLTLAFGCSSLLLATVGLLTIQIDKRVQSDTNETVHGIVGEAQAASQIFSEIQSLQELNHDFLIKTARQPLPQASQQEYLERIFLSLNQLEKKITMAQSATLNQKAIIRSDSGIGTNKQEKLAREQGEMEELNELLAAIRLSRQQWQSSLESQQPNSQAAFALANELRNDINQIIFPVVKEYYQDSLSEITEAELETQKLTQENIAIITNYVWFSFSLSLILFIYVYFSIYSPLKRLKSATTQLASNFGSYKPIKAPNPHDELGGLIAYFNETITTLQTKLTSKVYLDNIINSINQSLIVIDNRHKISKINDNITELLGYCESELIGKNLSELLTSSNPVSLNELINLDNLSSRCFSLDFLTKSSHTVTLTVYFSDLLDENSQKKGTICLAISPENLDLNQEIALQISKSKAKAKAKIQ